MNDKKKGRVRTEGVPMAIIGATKTLQINLYYSILCDFIYLISYSLVIMYVGALQNGRFDCLAFDMLYYIANRQCVYPLYFRNKNSNQ